MTEAVLPRKRALTRLWSEQLATLGVFVANGLGIGAWAAAIPRLKADLNLSDGALSLALLCFAAGAVVAMPLMGALAARIPTGRATCAAGLAFIASLALPALAGSLTLLCAATLIVGAANGAMDVAMNAHASDVERRRGRPIMSSFHAGFSLGGAVGAVLGARLGEEAAAAGLWGPALLGVILLALAAGSLWSAGGATRGAALALPGRRLLPLAALALLAMMTEGAIGDWSGTYLVRSGAPVALAAAGYASFSLCMIAGRIFGDAIVGRAGPRATVATGAILAAAGLATAVAAPGLATGVLGFALVGAGLSNVVPVIFSAAGRANASAAVGIASAATAGYAGLLLGPAAVGGIAEAAGLRTAIGFLALVAVFAAAIATTGSALRRTPRSAAERSRR